MGWQSPRLASTRWKWTRQGRSRRSDATIKYCKSFVLIPGTSPSCSLWNKNGNGLENGRNIETQRVGVSSGDVNWAFVRLNNLRFFYSNVSIAAGVIEIPRNEMETRVDVSTDPSQRKCAKNHQRSCCKASRVARGVLWRSFIYCLRGFFPTPIITNHCLRLFASGNYLKSGVIAPRRPRFSLLEAFMTGAELRPGHDNDDDTWYSQNSPYSNCGRDEKVQELWRLAAITFSSIQCAVFPCNMTNDQSLLF